MVCVAWAWLLLEAALAELRLATGAPRYLLPAVALAAVTGGCAWGDALLALRAFRPSSGALRLSITAWLCLLLASGYWLVVRTVSVESDWAPTTQADALVRAVPAAIAKLGGRQAALACGVATAPLQVPVVAWSLDVPQHVVGDAVGQRGSVLVVSGSPAVPPRLSHRYIPLGPIGPPAAALRALTTCPPRGTNTHH